jgi:DNA repair exonuclease SbcCD ATPase subunit
MRNNDILAKEMRSLEAYLNTLRERKDEVKSRVFTDDHCPYCGAELDPMEIENKKKAFNEAKKAELDAIVAEGKATKEKLERKQKEYAEGNGVVEDGMTLLEKLDITPYEEALARVEATFIPYEETDEFKQINAEIDALMSEIKEVPSNDNEALTSRKKALIDELSELSKKLGLKDEISKVENDILALRDELRSVANAIAELEGMIFTAKAWEQERNEIVGYRINSKLAKSKIEMWSTQKNGELVPDLVLCNSKGIKFNSTNFANRIEIVLDLQSMLNKLFDVKLPIFIDESAVFAPSTLPTYPDNQVIYLFASDEPYLTIS